MAKKNNKKVTELNAATKIKKGLTNIKQGGHNSAYTENVIKGNLLNNTEVLAKLNKYSAPVPLDDYEGQLAEVENGLSSRIKSLDIFYNDRINVLDAKYNKKYQRLRNLVVLGWIVGLALTAWLSL